jgi:hypothetical protein
MQDYSVRRLINEGLEDFRCNYFKRGFGVGYSFVLLGFKIVFFLACLVTFHFWELKVLTWLDFLGFAGVGFGVVTWLFVDFNKFWSLYFMYRGFGLLRIGYDV